MAAAVAVAAVCIASSPRDSRCHIAIELVQLLSQSRCFAEVSRTISSDTSRGFYALISFTLFSSHLLNDYSSWRVPGSLASGSRQQQARTRAPLYPWSGVYTRRHSQPQMASLDIMSAAVLTLKSEHTRCKGGVPTRKGSRAGARMARWTSG